MSIDFPSVNPRYTPNDTVAFAATVNGEQVTCEISREALEDHFGASSGRANDLVRAFISGRPDIEAVARKKLPHAAGRCLLVTADFGR